MIYLGTSYVSKIACLFIKIFCSDNCDYFCESQEYFNAFMKEVSIIYKPVYMTGFLRYERVKCGKQFFFINSCLPKTEKSGQMGHENDTFRFLLNEFSKFSSILFKACKL